MVAVAEALPNTDESVIDPADGADFLTLSVTGKEWFPMYRIFAGSTLSYRLASVLCLVMNYHKRNKRDNAKISLIMPFLGIKRSTTYAAVSELVKLGLLTRERGYKGREKCLYPAGAAAEFLKDITKGEWDRETSLLQLRFERAQRVSNDRAAVRHSKKEQEKPANDRQATVTEELLTPEEPVPTAPKPVNSVFPAEPTTAPAKPVQKAAGSNKAEVKRPRTTQPITRMSAKKANRYADAFADPDYQRLVNKISRKASWDKDKAVELLAWQARKAEHGAEMVIAAYERYVTTLTSATYAPRLKDWLTNKQLVAALVQECKVVQAASVEAQKSRVRVAPNFNLKNHQARLDAMDAAAVAGEVPYEPVREYREAWETVLPLVREELFKRAGSDSFDLDHVLYSNWLGAFDCDKDLARKIALIARNEGTWRKYAADHSDALRANLERESDFVNSRVSTKGAPLLFSLEG